MLRTLSGYPVILADRKRKLAEAGITLWLQVLIEGIQVLHGALAKRFLAREPIVLS